MECHNVYFSPCIVRKNKTRRMRLAGHVACKGDMRNTYINLIRKHQGVRCRGWDDNIKADLN